MHVILSKRAVKHFLHLSKSEQIRVKKKLFLLESDPFVGKKLEGELADQRSLRAWPYRIIYEINTAKERVEVNDILYRQGAYK